MFNRGKREKEFGELLFDELLRFHMERTTGEKLSEEHLGWRFYKHEEDNSPFNEVISPYTSILEDFVVWLIKKRGYDPKLVTDYFGYYPDEILGDLGRSISKDD